MKEIIIDELNHLKSCFEKLSEERTPENEWLRGYYKGKIAAYECALKLYEIERRYKQS